MADAFPPPNLPPESTPWGRKVQETATGAADSAAKGSAFSEQLNATQLAMGNTISGNYVELRRDIDAVNDTLSKQVEALAVRLNGHNTRIGTAKGKITTLEGRMNAAFEYLTDYGALINNLLTRMSTVEGRFAFPAASSLDGLEFIARAASGTLYRVPQSVGTPMGGDLKWPISLANVTDEFGPRDSPGGIGSTFHRGIDFGGGGPIKAAGRGVVVEAGPNGGLGNWVLIRHKPGLETGYGHMAPGSPIVSVGQAVSQGQTLGTMGTTGTSTGIHLHLEVHVNGVQTNPRSIISGTDTV